MTFRAIRILKEVDLILAEDTRTSGKLLKHFDIHTPMKSFHKFNEHIRVQNLVEQMRHGQKMALISDAGTPGISDPGFLLVRACVEHQLEVESLAGATAFVPALINSGLPSDKFYFEGFLPTKKGRQTRLQHIATLEQTVILYESPHKIGKTLEQLAKYCGVERKASVSREISKLYEETRRGTLGELSEYFSGQKNKGEFVIVIQGKNE
jgi:16S rRNA (cytidine1402-2'-O)-methyltransferase